MLAHLAGAAAQPPPLPERRRRAGLLAEGHPRDRAELAPTLDARSASTEREANEHLIADRVATLRVARQPGRVRGPRLDLEASMRPTARPSRSSTSTPGRTRPGTRPSRSPACIGPRWGTSAFAATRRRPVGAGIQIWIPIEPKYTFRDTSDWVEKLSRAVGGTVPDLVSWEWAKDRRGGKARLDYTQNASIKTLVAPYAVRPAEGAPVSTPITWDELDDPDLRSDRWTIRTVVDRVAKVGDLFAPAQTDLQVLPPI